MNFKPWLTFFICATFTLATSNSCLGQKPGGYQKEWKEVDGFIAKDLPKSALQRVTSIYQLAKKNGQDAQVIKALIYMIQLQGTLRENGDAKGIADAEKEASATNEPAKSILNSFTAGMYWRYFQQHRWQFYQRTNTRDFKKTDVATWTADDFHRKIGELYWNSIANSSLLQQTRLDAYDPIVTKGNMRHLRPTLFDLLAHQALEYFENDENELTQPAYAFQIEDTAAFAPAPDFSKHPFKTRDSSSLQYKALLIYQQLIAFHLNDAKPNALIDADLERIAFVHGKSVAQNKEALYLTALSAIAHRYEDMPAASQAWYLLADIYNENADSYQPYGDTTHRYDRLKAKEICERVLLQKDSSEGEINCYNLMNDLQARDLKFSIEKVNLPNQPFRALIHYKNIPQLFLRVVKADDRLKNQADDNDKFWDRITAADAFVTWAQNLPGVEDLQEHSTEIKINALPPGNYFLLVSSGEDFNPKKSLLGAGLFYVSAISYISKGTNFFVLDRETGKPLANASIQIWERKYDYTTSKYITSKGSRYITDDKGFFRLINKTYTGYLVDISYKGDRLFIDDDEHTYYNSDEPPSPPRKDIYVFLLTDRSIYRPGQTVYFKGIAIGGKNGQGTIETNFQSTIFLRNANQEVADSMTVTTNEYGSFSGKFQLPQSGLNGQFTLFMKGNLGSAGIDVEEYKRPKFFVDYEKLTGSFRINDTIRLTGFAKAYAGNNIDQATVKYRVVRRPRFIYDWLFWPGWHPPTEEMEISNGEMKTDKNGKFEIRFKAIPDLQINKLFNPVFDFTVYADVTDINGETRSGQASVSVGYQSLLLNVAVPQAMARDSFHQISVATTNLAGEFQPALVSVSITKLKGEERLIRNRYWERPDQFVMGKEEYVKLFPHDEYDNETDYRSWQKEKLVFEKEDSTEKSSEFGVQGRELLPGEYSIEVITHDKDGNEVKDIRYIQLYDVRSNSLANPQYLWTEGSKPVEPGETATIKIGTSASDIFLIQQVDKETGDGQPVTGNFTPVNLSNAIKDFEFNPAEPDRGGFGVSYFFVKDNRFYQFSDVIKVPWTNKELKIEYTTFRDKTLPGSEEKWKVKISGHKNEKVAAEMIASMYDASLDQFRPHNWYRPYIWPSYSGYAMWDAEKNFSYVESEEHDLNVAAYKSLNKNYDEFSFHPAEILRRSTYILRNETRIAYADVDANDPSKIVSYVVSKKARVGPISDTVVRELTGSVTIVNPKPSATQTTANILIRKNFNETAFFFPELHTDSTGSIEFSFTTPEALTKWKLQTFAHTKDLAFGLASKETVTQKELMVQPNTPRFLREGDRIELSAKIVNLTDTEFTGQAQLELIDASTNQTLDGAFQNMFANQYFTVAAGQSEALKFPIQVPYQFTRPLLIRIMAQTNSLPSGGLGWSDGEEDVLPILTNKTMVTETLPLNMRGPGTKNFKFEKLLNSSQLTEGEQGTFQNHALTVEFTSNPAWFAVQALPYLAEYPYECAEQTWNRYYANALAGIIANSAPRIREIFSKWTDTTKSFEGALEKNQELKSVLLEETPWVLEAKSEQQQKKNIAFLFDLVKMARELRGALEKLKAMQTANGGFAWFTGGPDDRYITQYIMSGIGHLRKLAGHDILGDSQNGMLKTIVAAAIPYLDKKMNEDYQQILKRRTNKESFAGDLEIQYFYMRSFFPEIPIPNSAKNGYGYFRRKLQSSWAGQSKYMQGMIALSLWRTGDAKTPQEILRSLKETAMFSEELGMYWPQTRAGWLWYEAPVETQSLMVEVFQEIAKDRKTVDDLKTWLLKNKQANDWKTTKATAEACYALLLEGSQWLSNQPSVQLKLGNTIFTNDTSEAGTGYFKKTVEAENINPEMGRITLSIGSSKASPIAGGLEGAGACGAVYWQYFEDLDKIRPASTPLQLSRKLFVEKNSERGPILAPVNEGEELNIGDKIKVRIELRADRDMEYVHMKDMRASCFEPVNVMSAYKWQDGLGYYESTRDASTNFFFDYLGKGTYVFEYTLFVTHAGNFSDGITTIQCMYAPEFSSHSEGMRVAVVE